MSRYRLLPTPAQQAVLRDHCAHARYMWNLAVEQQHWRHGRAGAPGYLEQCRQLTAARAAHPWLTGELLNVPRLGSGRQRRLILLQRKLARAKRGSKRRAKVRLLIARLRAREKDARKDWCEKVSTDLARRFDVIRIEDLKVQIMTRSAKGTVAQPGRNVQAKASLNREIRASGWGLLVHRLEDKAPGRVEKVNPRFTSQRCSACGHIAAESRKSQALFACAACNFTLNADVNAARNIAAGHAVTARGGFRDAGPANREPQLLASLAGRERLPSPAFPSRAGEDVKRALCQFRSTGTTPVGSPA